jgi:hypothetical protein
MSAEHVTPGRQEEQAEEWVPVPDFPGYEVSNLGRVKSHRGNSRGAVLKCPAGKNGYRVIRLRKNNAYHNWYVHRLVAFVFHGPPPDGTEVCHKNGIRADCRASNLRWGTRSENAIDKVKHGTHYQPNTKGEAHPLCRLTEAQVVAIRARRAEGIPHSATAKEFGITTTHACRIALGRSWKCLPA